MLPLLIFDFATGLALDTALIMQLSNLYGLELKGHSARKLLKRLSIYFALLGGVQIGIQFSLGVLRQLLIFTAPITGGISLASAAPIAVAQAALAVHTTRVTGRLAAEILLRGSHHKGVQPRAMLQRLANKDPDLKVLLGKWQGEKAKEFIELQALLP